MDEKRGTSAPNPIKKAEIEPKKTKKHLDKKERKCYNDLTSSVGSFFVRTFLRQMPMREVENSNLSGGAAMRVKITMVCSECKQRNYETKKNKKNDPDRLEMNKYCRFCRKHTLHKESK